MSIEKVNDLVTRGKAKLTPAAVQEALDEGCEATAILDAMISAMDVVGEKFKNGEIFVPEMLIAAKAMKKGVEVLKPHLERGFQASKNYESPVISANIFSPKLDDTFRE